MKTGRTETQRVISIGGGHRSAGSRLRILKNYDTRVVDRYAIGPALPVYITEYEYSEVNIVSEPVDLEVLYVKLEEQAYHDALGYVPKEAKIQGHSAGV